MTIQKQFAQRVVATLQDDEHILGLAVAGSWLTDEIDAYSDLDLILVTREKIGGNRLAMLQYAEKLGNLLSGFTGEHVGEPRVLICLYADPLLHVDLKFVTAEEFRQRIETPFLLLDKEGALAGAIEETEARFPYPDYQWIEDRFWIWIHYALLKIGRGEYMEAYDFSGFLRMVVFGPLLHIKNGNLPRGVRKVETALPAADRERLQKTLPGYSRNELLESLMQCVHLYRHLREAVYPSQIELKKEAEQAVMGYFKEIEDGEVKSQN